MQLPVPNAVASETASNLNTPSPARDDWVQVGNDTSTSSSPPIPSPSFQTSAIDIHAHSNSSTFAIYKELLYVWFINLYGSLILWCSSAWISVCNGCNALAALCITLKDNALKRWFYPSCKRVTGGLRKARVFARTHITLSAQVARRCATWMKGPGYNTVRNSIGWKSSAVMVAALSLPIILTLSPDLFDHDPQEMFCRFPVAEWSSICQHSDTNDSIPVPSFREDFSQLVELQTGTFSPVLGIQEWPQWNHIDAASIATRELAAVVLYSDLDTREVFARALLRLHQDFKDAKEGVESLTEGIEGSYRRLTAMDDLAIRHLRRIQHRRLEISKTSSNGLVRFITGGSTESLHAQDRKNAEIKVVYESLLDEATRVVDDMEARVNAARKSFSKIDNSLAVVYDMTQMQKASVTWSQDMIDMNKRAAWIESWGANPEQERKNERNLQVLKEVEAYKTSSAIQLREADEKLKQTKQAISALRTLLDVPRGLAFVDAEDIILIIQSGVEFMKSDFARLGPSNEEDWYQTLDQ